MNRRDFMRTMFGTAVSIAVPQIWTPKLPIISSRAMRIPLEIRPGGTFIYKPINESQIIAAELERVAPFLTTIFDREDIFYNILANKNKK